MNAVELEPNVFTVMFKDVVLFGRNYNYFTYLDPLVIDIKLMTLLDR